MAAVYINLHQGSTYFLKNLESPQKCRRQKGDMIQGPYLGPTNVGAIEINLAPMVTWRQGFVHP